jgi:PadR family transcriptional regulator, regulatory protein PadR
MRITEEIVKGSLKFIILSLLVEQDEYGYSLAQKIRDRSNDLVKAGEGSLYPALYKLESEGFISSYWDESVKPKRKYYTITDDGRKLLATERPKIQQFAQIMDIFSTAELKLIS